MKTNLLVNNLVKIEKNQDYSDVKISIETIDKRKALEYLDKNFKEYMDSLYSAGTEIKVDGENITITKDNKKKSWTADSIGGVAFDKADIGEILKFLGLKPSIK